MKTYLFAFIVLILISNMALGQDDDKKAIEKVIQTAYVEGLQNEADTVKINSGIHSGFNLLGVGEGNEMWAYPIAEWKAKVVERKNKGELPPEDNKKVSVEFKSIDITGTAAVAKIEFFVGKELRYVDYISLYKFEDGWKMVNKIFYKF